LLEDLGVDDGEILDVNIKGILYYGLDRILSHILLNKMAVSFGHNNKSWDSKAGRSFLIGFRNIPFPTRKFLSLLYPASHWLHYFHRVCHFVS
jgi:hypothetical protein